MYTAAKSQLHYFFAKLSFWTITQFSKFQKLSFYDIFEVLCLDISRQNAKNAFQSDENTIKMLFSLVEKGFQQNSVKYLQKMLIFVKSQFH